MVAGLLRLVTGIECGVEYEVEHDSRRCVLLLVESTLWSRAFCLAISIADWIDIGRKTGGANASRPVGRYSVSISNLAIVINSSQHLLP